MQPHNKITSAGRVLPDAPLPPDKPKSCPYCGRETHAFPELLHFKFCGFSFTHREWDVLACVDNFCVGVCRTPQMGPIRAARRAATVVLLGYGVKHQDMISTMREALELSPAKLAAMLEVEEADVLAWESGDEMPTYLWCRLEDEFLACKKAPRQCYRAWYCARMKECQAERFANPASPDAVLDTSLQILWEHF